MGEGRREKDSNGSVDPYDVYIQCPQCMSEMVVSSEARGRMMACAVCGCEFEVPLDDETEQDVLAARQRRRRRAVICLRIAGWFSLAAGVFGVMSLLADSLLLWPFFLFSVLLGLLLLGFRDAVHGTLIGVCSILIYSLLVRVIPHTSDMARNRPAPSDMTEQAAATVCSTPEPVQSEAVETSNVPAPPPAAPESKPAGTAPSESPSVEAASGSKSVAAVPAEVSALNVETEWPVNENGQLVPDMPFVLYSDCYGKMPYSPFGWMGNVSSFVQHECWKDNVHSGKTCVRIVYDDTGGLIGGTWQAPPSNWGTKPALYDLSKAVRLTFWARGERGDEIVEFKAGYAGTKGPYKDSTCVSTGKIRLTTSWKQYTIDLRMANLTHMINGFSWMMAGASTERIIYLDDIQYEGPETP